MRNLCPTTICLAWLSIVTATAFAQPEDQPKPGTRLEVYSLKYAQAKEAARMIQGMIDSGTRKESRNGFRLSVDERTNSLIVAADKEAISIVRSLLEVVDRPGEPASSASSTVSRNIEVAWLTDGPGGKELPPIFGNIQASLQQKGIRNLRLAAMATTRVINGGDFVCGSSPKLGDRKVAFDVSGTLREATKPQDMLSVQIDATEKKESGPSHRLAQLRTDVSTPTGRPVVLAVAPLEDRTSVFVITISRVE